MNAIAKSPFAWLLKREYWESRRSFLRAQVIAAGVIIVLSLLRRAAMLGIEWSAFRANPSATLQQGFIPMIRNIVTLFVFAAASIMILRHFGYDVLSLLTALFITDWAPLWMRPTLIRLTDLMAAVPGIVFGLWVLLFIQPHATHVTHWLSKTFGWIPFFHVRGTGAARTGTPARRPRRVHPGLALRCRTRPGTAASARTPGR